MQEYTQNMHKICNNIDCNTHKMQIICTKYADTCKKYPQNMPLQLQNLQNDDDAQ